MKQKSMPRWVLCNLEGDASEAELATIRGNRDVRIIDDSRRYVILAEGEETSMAVLAKQLPGWDLRPETWIPVPDMGLGRS